MSSSEDSDDAAAAEERAKIIGCVITEDELKVAAHAEAKKKRRREPADEEAAAAERRRLRDDEAAAPEPADSDFRRHTARKLGDVLSRNFEVAEGVWSDAAAASTAAPSSELRIFAGGSAHRHEDPAPALNGAAPAAAPRIPAASVEPDAKPPKAKRTKEEKLARREKKRLKAERKARKEAPT